MQNLLIRLFVKDRDNVRSPVVRRAYGKLVSAVGILLNLLLAAFKLLAGLLTGSIAISADAVNNLSDAGSSVISLISFKIASKPADRDHPFGHARIEYVASMIVAFLILLIGVDLVKDSVGKLIAPVTTAFRWAVVVILSLSVLAKLWLALFNRSVSRRIDSDVMRATSADSLSDAVATSAVLVATLLAHFLRDTAVAPYIDPVMGLIVAALILLAGLKVLNDTKNSILGEAPDEEVVKQIEELIAQYPEAVGIHDMVVHSYGPGRTLASVHIEVDGKKDIFASHDTVDNIERRLQREYGIECTVHLDPIITDDPLVNEWRERVQVLASTLGEGIRIHDFRMVPGTTHTNLIFDMEVPFEIEEKNSVLKARMAELIAAEAPNYFAVVTVDRV